MHMISKVAHKPYNSPQVAFCVPGPYCELHKAMPTPPKLASQR